MGRKGSRYTLEQKLFYVGLIQDDTMTASGIEKQYGIKFDQVKIWLERYNCRGVDGLKHSLKNRRYSLEFKQMVIKEYLAGGTSYHELARKYQIPNISTIYQWVSRYTSGKSLDFTRRRP